MHDCLHIRHISRIKSTRMRQLANGIAAGSERDLITLCDLLPTFPSSETILVLPALFVNIDINRLPHPSELDTLLSNRARIPYIDLAFHSLRAISHLSSPSRIPVHASADLWPYIWNWMDFFHTYWDFLPTAQAFTQIILCIVHAPIILALDKDAQTSKAIRSTPGVRFVLAMAWRGMLGEDELFTRPGALLAISEAVSIATENAKQGSNFDELVEAAGGTVKDLASLVIQHFSRAQFTQKSKETVIFLLSCFRLLYGSSDATYSLGVALRSMGFVAKLITTICESRSRAQR
ncbi:hypothetical protein K438DRAFT_1183569 [Mycena galopus ATCC 62051]|nr:hypothetical protein K438DRAFT_1183569 [Mycena galopus ATCC 62051]